MLVKEAMFKVPLITEIIWIRLMLEGLKLFIVIGMVL